MQKEQELSKVFQKASFQAEANLSENIWHSIVIREKRIAKFKLTIFSTLGALSFAGAFPIFKSLLTDFSQSGFSGYLSLIFSNFAALASSWKELAYSLAETLPVVSILLSVSVVFVFFLSIRYVLKQIIKSQLSLKFNV
jgi:hypothetical protein